MTILVNIITPILVFYIEIKIKNRKERDALESKDNQKKIDYIASSKGGIIKDEKFEPNFIENNKEKEENSRKRHIKSCLMLAFPAFFSLISLILYYLFPVLTFTTWTGWIFSILILTSYVLLFVCIWKYYKTDLFKEFKDKKTTTLVLSVLAISICYTLCLGIIFVCFEKSITWKVLLISAVIVLFGLLLAVNLLKNDNIIEKKSNIRYRLLLSLFCISSLLTSMLVNAFTTNLFEFTNFTTSYIQYGKYYYQKNSDDTLTFMMSDYNVSTLVVPTQAKGKKVVAIKCIDKYYGSKKLKNFTIPEGIEKVDKAILYGCSNLQQLSLPSLDWTYEGGVKGYDGAAEFQVTLGYLFGSFQFDFANRIEQTTVGKYISGEKVNEEELFTASYYIPSSLYKVSLQGGEIKRGVFENCTNINEISINNTKIIEKNAFLNCGAVKNIDGINYVDGWAIGATEIGDSVILLNDTIGIANEAFLNESFTNIKLNDGLKYIGRSAFAMCGNLTDFEIPSSVQFIGKQAFYKCENLNSIKFNNVYNWFVNKIYFNSENFSNLEQIAANLTSDAKYYNADWTCLTDN